MASETITSLPTAGGIDGAADWLAIDTASPNATNKISRNILLGVTGQPADISSVQTITNKVIGNTNTVTLKDTLLTLQDDGDTTKQAKFQLSGITTATTRTYTLPNVTDTLVSLTASQTLTNKTLTSPAITGGTIDNSTITVDSIAGHSTSTIVTVAGMQISSGVINTANAVTATSIAAAAVQPQALTAGTGTGWTFQSYTPTFTNLTPGNGVFNCAYTQIGKLIVVRIHFKFGTTSSMGTTPTMTLPLSSIAGYIAGHWLGGMRIVSGGNGFTGYFQWASTTTVLLLALNSSATYVSDTSANFTAAIPGAWTTNDSFDGTLFYESA